MKSRLLKKRSAALYYERNNIMRGKILRKFHKGDWFFCHVECTIWSKISDFELEDFIQFTKPELIEIGEIEARQKYPTVFLQ
jgi:hypothetical protein